MLYQTLRRIEAQHRERPFDVLHAIWADETGFISNWAGKRLNVPTVVTIAGGELVGFDDIGYGLQSGRISRWLVRQALMGAAMIIAPSEYTQKLALDFLPTQKHNTIQMIPLGVDTELFTPPEPDLDWRPREYLHVGSLNAVKDQGLLLRLVATLPNATLDIVGDGPRRSELEALTHKLRIEDRVVFHGEVAHEKLPAYYQEARYLLMTSRHEAFCMAAIEAIACGTGVIGTATGILPEVGLTAPVGDIDALQHAIVHRIRKRGQIQRKRNRLLAEQIYSIRQMVNNMEAVYRSLVQKVG
jgi:glycosyltransferase involved in cell wall biosynthesis